MSRKDFEAAAARAAAALGPPRTKDVAGMLAQGAGHERILHALPISAAEPAVTELLACMTAGGIPAAEAAAYLRGYVAAWSAQLGAVDVSTVWTGPATPGVPVRSTAQVLTEVVREARTELIAMTYSARAFEPLKIALRDALARGVAVDVVVETRAGARGLLDGPEPAAAFADVPGVRIWHWPIERREHPGARQHAKLAVADQELLFLGSANLTASGVGRNLEAGVLVRGGTAPVRATEHIRELIRKGILRESA
ncbi:DISARM system phospholipase D-like protein DrmC [Kitasatospora herbaricolor]|uniref:DISARM system phospholipase D-like protein DrmC n=1 Tax=Kitasatospora herbaricolor TaxID=68217 RepID=A0ABZ1WFV2_9ACTN|nr:DISARM system phospholipase D-like protein DrmC [Kitasatospora herbaricolor]